jgi:uracil-DNA glycosylase family 4
VDESGALAQSLARTLRARATYLGRLYAARRGARPAADDWAALRAEAMACTRCGLCRTRTNVVFGEGDEGAELMFVGEAPGAEEDEQGRPFVGRAGRLLTDMIAAMGLAREEVYIANVLKCRPPENRAPAPDEVESCRPFLERQLALVAPKVVCALGSHAVRALLGRGDGITKLRGKVFPLGAAKLVPTFHPAYLLRNPAAKREVWEDLKLILGLLGRPVPAVRKPPAR